VLLSGLARVDTIAEDGPKSEQGFGSDDDGSFHSRSHGSRSYDSLYIVAGVNPLVVAVDTDPRAKGHLTFYPADVETAALQIPFRDGRVPDHTVVRGGACL